MECILLMIKIKLILIFLAMSMLIAGITSCSSEDVTTTGNESYISGTYSGNKLNFTLDGVQLQNITANVTVENVIATIKLTGFPESGSTVTWTSTMKETGNGIECLGEYTPSVGKQTYRYIVLFQGSYDGISCKIVCKTVN